MTDTEIAYNQALDYLYSFVDYSLKHISELAKAEFNLDRMFALMEELGNPQNEISHHPRGGDEGQRLGRRVVRLRVAGGGIQNGLVYLSAFVGLCGTDPDQRRADLA